MEASPQQKRQPKVCGSCNLTISGQFVRALQGTYHVECFKCYECGNPCSNRFFPLTVNSETVALCELDYFKKLDLICHTCQKALRGPYITALNRKYHVEHFTCHVCHRVFESDENFYEHDDAVFCHYHYSKLYASHCEGCQSSILKQFVEVYRGGRQQQWHPECYMVHKFWNVSITPEVVGLSENKDPSAKQLFETESLMEQTILSVWMTLSGFEESIAACISDMLQFASACNQQDGLSRAGLLVLKVEMLFHGIDALHSLEESFLVNSNNDSRVQSLRKEPRNLSAKIMTYLAILRRSGESRGGSFSQDLLTLITGLAHYLKLMIRFGLSMALYINKNTASCKATDRFLQELNLQHGSDFDSFSALEISPTSTDACMGCQKPIERQCVRFRSCRWHPECVVCHSCGKVLEKGTLFEFCFDSQNITCAQCSTHNVEAQSGFVYVSSLEQLVYLLKIALVRSRHFMARHEPATRSRSAEQSYKRTLTDIKRMRSLRSNEKLSLPVEQSFRRSRIIEGKDLLIEHEHKPQVSHLDRTSDLLRNEKSLTLDDIPRIVAAEQAREQRPNAFRHQDPLSMTTKDPKTKQIRPLTRDNSQKVKEPSLPRYFSQTSEKEHFILRHLAALALVNLLGVSKEEAISKVETKKVASIWEKLFPKNTTIDTVFGIPLKEVTKKFGVESDHGVGPSKLRIPLLVDDCISALHQMDMSVEGVFRKNGNIKGLKNLTLEINKHPNKMPDLTNETPIQLAALLKKFLRELPDPLLTLKLYDFWILSQKCTKDVNKRKRILRLVYCMLPTPNRDLLEVLLYFFGWVASFSHIDNETGSKMDVHNLATVITPNILYSHSENEASFNERGEAYFLAIEVVNNLIEAHEELCIVPPDLMELFKHAGLDKVHDPTPKEIVTRCEAVFAKNPNFFDKALHTESLVDDDDDEVHLETVKKFEPKGLEESRGVVEN